MIHILLACPQCEAPLVARTNRETQQEFLGCSQYPSCKYIAPISEHIRQALQGAPRLPGF